MRLHPAKQEKTNPKTKRSLRRAQHSTRRTPPQAATSRTTHAREETLEEDATDRRLHPEGVVEGAPHAPSLMVPSPVFVRCDITTPDGGVRPGWEMWIGDHCFGRADSKELLLASFQRLQSPPESFHWREVRNRMQMRGRPRATQSDQDRDESWEWDKKEDDAPLLVGEEEAEGFQELTWENPA